MEQYYIINCLWLLTFASPASRYFGYGDENVVRADPDQIWIDLCHGTEQAVAYCQAFFRSCIENSVRKFVILGPREHEYRRTLNSAAAVTQIWRNLIAKADSEVLALQRRKDRANQSFWRLRYVDHTKPSSGPVSDISKVGLSR
jgi:hypothetical protein